MQEGGADAVLGEIGIRGQEVDGGRRGPLGALVEEELRQGVGPEILEVLRGYNGIRGFRA